MEIYLIRHTAPELTPGLIYGRLEVSLTGGFIRESEVVSNNLPNDLDCVYSSPALRCTLLAAELTGSFTTDPRLAELHFGDWEGKTWDSVDQTDLQIWMDDFINVRVPGGESMLDLRNRVEEFWQELMQKTHEKVAIVTHAGVIRMLLTLHRQSAMEDFFKIEVAYGQVILINP